MEYDLAMLLRRAERGYSVSQKMASQIILQTDDYPDRYFEAVRWLLIARVLDQGAVSEDVIEYLVVSLYPTRYDEVFDTAERWLDEKVENSAGEDEAEWSPELRQYKYPDQTLKKRGTDEEEYARELYHQALLKQWGEAKDINGAIPQYRASANFGFAGAQNNLGDCYEQGRGVPQSDLAAMFWFTQAAERGEPTAFLSLANMLNRTQADEATLVEALKFAYLARLNLPEGGNKDLAKGLEELIAAKLSHEECQKAYEMATTWKPLYQEEFLLSDSPEFTPMNAERLKDAGG